MRRWTQADTHHLDLLFVVRAVVVRLRLEAEE